jgi:hypothetical protein
MVTRIALTPLVYAVNNPRSTALLLVLVLLPLCAGSAGARCRPFSVPLYDCFHFMQSMARMGITRGARDWLGTRPARVLIGSSVAWRKIFEREVVRLELSDEDFGFCMCCEQLLIVCAREFLPGSQRT